MTDILTPRSISSKRIWLARAVAVVADVIQVAIFPLFAEGALSPLNTALDILVAIVLISLVGWHVAFVPSFVVEMLPIADLAPTWSIATWIATTGKRAKHVHSIVRDAPQP